MPGCKSVFFKESKQRAFTLVEVMVALSVLLVVSLTFIMTTVYNARNAVRAKSEVFATDLTDRMIEQMRSVNNFFNLGTNNGAEAIYMNPMVFPSDPANPDAATNFTVTCRFKGFGAVESASATTLTADLPAGREWVENEWIGHLVMIQGGAGRGQIGYIKSNTGDTLTITRSLDGNGNAGWYKTPAAGDAYEIDNGKTVEITVDWTDQGDNRSITRTALIPGS